MIRRSKICASASPAAGVAVSAEYDKDDPAAILLPASGGHETQFAIFAIARDCGTAKRRAKWRFDDVKLSLRLAEAIRTEPFIISHTRPPAILQIALQPIWEGLAEHRWSDAQLAALDGELAKLDFLADYEFAPSAANRHFISGR